MEHFKRTVRRLSVRGDPGAHDPAGDDHHAFLLEETGLLSRVGCHQPSVGAHDPPPREPLTAPENRSHRSSSAWKAGFFGDLSIGRDLTGAQSTDGSDDRVFEGVRHAGSLALRDADRLEV